MSEKRVPKVRLMDIIELAPRLQEKARQWKEMGSDPTLLRVFGHLPVHIYLSFLDFYNFLRFEGRVNLPLKEIIRLRVANLNECHF